MTGRLPQLPGAGILGDDGSPSPKKQQLEFMYKPRDARKVQSLDAVFTLDDLRRSGALGPRGPIKSSLAYPGLTPNFLNEPLAGVNSDDDEAEDDDDEEARSEGGSSGALRARRRGRGPPRSPSPDQASRSVIDLQRYNATAAARTAMLHEKPSVVERMEKGVAACAVMRDNRHFRLFSLGVFQPTVNEVRTRSMHRVELHKHLSATTLRAPQTEKEVRSAVQHDTVAARLERMYNKVVRQVEESAPGSPNLYGASGSGLPGSLGTRQSVPAALSGVTGGGRRGGGAGALLGGQQQQAGVSTRGPRVLVVGADIGLQGPGSGGGLLQQQQPQHAGEGANVSRGRSPVLNRTVSIKGAPAGGSGTGMGSQAGAAGPGIGNVGSVSTRYSAAAGSPSPSPLPAPGSPTSGAREREREGPLGQASQRTAHSSDYWLRVTLPPEVIEAQLRHLAATTEANLRTYHERVAAAQDALLQCNGLGPDSLSMATDAVEQSLKIKLGQIQEDTSVTSYNYSSLSHDAVLASQLTAASKQLLTATTLPQFIRAALDHVSQHSEELQTFKALRRPDEGKFRRRAAAVAAAKSAVGPGSAAGPRADSARGPSYDAGSEASGTQDGSEASGSGIWPTYLAVRPRAASAGPPHIPPTAKPFAAGGSGAAAAAMRPCDDQYAHLEHLRRTASPDSTVAGGSDAAAGGERRWSPPPPVMVPGSRGIPLAPASVLGGGGAMPQPPRRTGTFMDHHWMEGFRDKLHEAEETFPDSPPEGLLPLPPLPAGDMDAGAYVRSRLERLWTLLDMPPEMRLDLVLAFTGRDRALLFAKHLEMWEQAAVAVLGREAQVEALVTMQHEIEAGRADQLSRAQVSGLCLRVLQQTRWVEALSERLQDECGKTLSYHGKPYPGTDAITSAHLLAFLEQLRQITQGTGLRP